MIWLTWRQHRKQALFTAVGLAVIAALMIPTGLAMRHAFVKDGVPACLNEVGHAELIPRLSESCNAALNQFKNGYGNWSMVGVLFLVLPLLVGMFWGAPLVAREVEHGTHRLVWTQGISRRRWAGVKFGLVGLATLAAATLYGLGMSWWLTPLSRAGSGRLTDFFFDVQGIAPIGYTLFAVALGVFAGTVWHKVLPAMAVTLVGFLGLRIAVTVLGRTRYLPARTLTFPVQGPAVEPNELLGNWVVATGVRNSDGRLVAADTLVACPPNMPKAPDGQPCGARLGLDAGAYNWMLYQPAGRFWLFQGIETGIYITLTALLLYLAIRRIRRIA
jgi:hypothetical protein